jgi:hypothetical protein
LLFYLLLFYLLRALFFDHISFRHGKTKRRLLLEDTLCICLQCSGWSTLRVQDCERECSQSLHMPSC